MSFGNASFASTASASLVRRALDDENGVALEVVQSSQNALEEDKIKKLIHIQCLVPNCFFR